MNAIHPIVALGAASMLASYVPQIAEVLRLALLALMVLAHCQHQAKQRRSSAAKAPRKRKVPVVPAALVTLTLLCLVGCSSTNLAEVVKAAAGDTNAVSLHVSSPWGSADYSRNLRP